MTRWPAGTVEVGSVDYPAFGLPAAFGGRREAVRSMYLFEFHSLGHHLSLLHGEPRSPQGWGLIVDTAYFTADDDLDDHRDWLADELYLNGQPLPNLPPPAGFSQAEVDVLMEQRLAKAWALGPYPWTPLELPIDGQPVGFEVLHDGPAWAATRTDPPRVINLLGRNLPPERIQLITITDLSSYRDGNWRGLVPRPSW